MAKKSAIYNEYIVQVKDDGSIEVFRIFDNVKESLREAATTANFEYDSNWGTRQFGHNLVKEFGENNMAHIGNYVIAERENGSIETYRTYDNTKAALREISEKCGFEINADWTTRQLGSKLVDFLLK